MMILIVFGYLLPVFLMWKYTSLAHSKKGVYRDLTPSSMDLWYTFFPVLNLIGYLVWIFEYPIIRTPKHAKDYSKLFKVKK